MQSIFGSMPGMQPSKEPPVSDTFVRDNSNGSKETTMSVLQPQAILQAEDMTTYDLRMLRLFAHSCHTLV